MFISIIHFSKKNTIFQSARFSADGFLLVEVGVSLALLLLLCALSAIWYAQIVMWQERVTKAVQYEATLVSSLDRIEYDTELARSGAYTENKVNLTWQMRTVHIPAIVSALGVTVEKKIPYSVALVTPHKDGHSVQRWIIGTSHAHTP